MNREIGKKVRRVILLLRKGAGSSVASAVPSTEEKAKRRVTPASFPLCFRWPLLFSLSGNVSFNEACSTQQIQKEHLEVI